MILKTDRLMLDFLSIFSLVVSNLNSLATVTWEDFLSQVPQFKSFNDRQQLFAIKAMSKYILIHIQSCWFFIVVISS